MHKLLCVCLPFICVVLPSYKFYSAAFCSHKEIKRLRRRWHPCWTSQHIVKSHFCQNCYQKNPQPWIIRVPFSTCISGKWPLPLSNLHVLVLNTLIYNISCALLWFNLLRYQSSETSIFTSNKQIYDRHPCHYPLNINSARALIITLKF